jgi:predicted transcriptional regulator YdeE
MTNGFKVIGISTRTKNSDNQSQQDLGRLWQRFYAEQIFEKIPNKVSDSILAIYTDYEIDYTGAYTSIIGVPVSSLDAIPDGLIGRAFSAEKFQIFVADGEMPVAVVQTWMEIWSMDKELHRKYTYDFEVYGKASQHADNPVVDIYIAVE